MMEELFDESITLETPRVLMRIIREEDAQELSELLDPSLWDYFPAPIEGLDGVTQWINDTLAAFDAKQCIPFVTIEKATGKIVGSTRYANISERDMRMEIGYTWLGKDHHGSGLNTHQKYAMLENGFENWGLKRIEFKTDVLNERSRAALLKIGATEEGILRSHSIVSGGRRRDVIYYSILPEEWVEVKKRLLEMIGS